MSSAITAEFKKKKKKRKNMNRDKEKTCENDRMALTSESQMEPHYERFPVLCSLVKHPI